MSASLLSPSFKRELAEHNPIGMLLTEEDVQAWFDMVWLRFSTRRYRNRRRAIIAWWSRVKEHEILEARNRAERMRDEKETALLEAMIGQAPEEPANVVQAQDRFARVARR